MMNTAAQSALARLEKLNLCMGAVSDLMIPERDLHIVKRDKLALLLEFFTEEYEQVHQTLRLQ